MAQTVQLKRSALTGKVPGTGSLNLGELALNTYDGKIFFRRSGSTDTVQEVITTNVLNTGSVTLTGTLTAGSIVGSITASNGVVSGSSQITLSSGIGYSKLATTGSNQFTADQNITGSLRATLTGSFGSLKVNDTLTINHGETIISGSALVTSDLTILGAVNARQFNISVISSSVLFQSGSTRFGNTSDDTHDFTGSVNVTGSLYLNGVTVGGSSNSGSFTGSFTGSFFGDGSGLRGVVSDDIPRDGWDYDSNSSASINDFNDVSDKYFIDFEQSQSTEVGTPVGFKGFLTNVSGSTQILPTLDSINFIVRDNLVASIGVGGIIAQATAGTVSGSSQLTSSYDTRYLVTGSVTSSINALNTATSSYETKGRSIVSGSSQITFSGISSLPTLVSGSSQITYTSISSIPSGIVSGSSELTASFDLRYLVTGSVTSSINALNTATSSYETKGRGIVSGSSQLTASVLATTGSNSFIGNQNISGTLYLTGSLIPSGNFVYDLGSETNSFKDLFLSTGSIRFHNPDGTEQGRITVDASSGDISLLKTAGLTNEQKATISQGNINPNFLTAISASSLFVQTKIVTAASATINGINLTAFSSSIASTLLNQNTATSSYETKGRGIVSGSSQITFSGISSLPTLVSGSSQITYASISSIPSGIVSSSVQVLGGTGIVSGSSQITYTSISSIPGGIVSGSSQVLGGTGIVSGSSQVTPLLPTGVISGSSQLSGTTITNLTVTNLTTVNETASVIFSSGSNTFGDAGNDTHNFTGSVQISGSQTIIGSSTATSYNGTINATNGVVSGSSQVTPLLPTGTVSGSSQVVGILSSLNTYTGSQDTKNSILALYTASLDTKNSTLATYTASVNSQLSNLNTATSSYETKGRSIVSGSSQVVGSSITTNTITIGSTSTALGGTSTTLAGLTSVSSTGFTGALTGNASTATTAAALTTARTINGTSFDGSTNITIPNLVSGSSQITLSSTTGYGSVLNQAVLTTSTPTFAGATFSGNVTINTNISGLILNRTAVTNYNGISLQTAAVSQWFVGMRENLSSNNYIIYNESGTDALTISKSNNNATFAGTITETSSLRYKENVETIKYGLDKVLKMRGVTYNKKNNGVKEIGVIAEEIYEVLPEVVLKNEEGDIDSVSYSRITAVLIEAIKDLKKEIEDLKANR